MPTPESLHLIFRLCGPRVVWLHSPAVTPSKTSCVRGAQFLEPTPLGTTGEPLAPFPIHNPQHVGEAPGACPSPFLALQHTEPDGLPDGVLCCRARHPSTGRNGINMQLASAASP